MLEKSQQRVAIVTGASSGIGRVTAIQLASHGWTIVAVARRKEELDALLPELGDSSIAVVADVSAEADLERVLSSALTLTGRVDALLNVAGLGDSYSIMTDDVRVQQLVAVNLLAPIRLMRAVVPIMRAQGFGAIVNVGSVAGEIGIGGIYSATKFGLRGITDSVRRELAGTGILVSLVEPGYVETPLTARRKGRMPGPGVVADAIERCLTRRHRRLIVPWRYRSAVLLSTIAPWLIDRMYAGKIVDE